ncbi:MAG: putative ATP-dependent endonuclease of OLD family [Flavobacteriaceae bacterium]|jgi:predicted ATP-dependent endonuclease of OLD family
MFRIEFLKLTKHPQLGTIELNLSEFTEYKKADVPYTSVIIGSNGTGKSFILRTIAEIFRQFQEYSVSESEKKIFNLPYSFHLRYQLLGNTYEIVTRKLEVLTGNKRKDYVYYKNRPIDVSFDGEILFEKKTGFEINHKELEFPEKLLVNSIMNNDRFVFKKSEREDFYQYLGVRSTSSTASTKSLTKRTINTIYEARELNTNFKSSLKELLNLLEFKERFRVRYNTKIYKLFFSGDLTEDNFKQYFEHWWDEDFIYSKREEKNPLWSIPYYNNNVKNNSELLKQLVSYLNQISNEKNRFEDPLKPRSNVIAVDVLNDDITSEEIKLIQHLKDLDIIDILGIDITKDYLNISISEISSGEYHLLISMIGIFANLPDNSLILIDEPEISLHPNWQMRYITFLKKVFSKFNGCQFVLTTHSHFLVSDLEPKSSHLLGVKKENNIIKSMGIKSDTYGWSAEDVLYNIFDVPSTRNFYVAKEVGSILKEISKKEINRSQITNKIKKLSNLKRSLKENDPLRSLIIKVEKEFIDA